MPVKRPGRRPLVAAAFLALGAFPLAAPPAAAQWPERPIRIIVPYQPGGGTDVVGRILAQKVSESLGQPVVVENRSGASGTIAGRYVATSAPDGYTLLIDSLSIAQNASLFRNPGFSAQNDLLPVAQLVELPFIVALNRRTRARDLHELVALAKQQNGAVTVAESGTSPRLTGELFKLVTGTQFTFVPYRGSAPAVAAVLSGEVQLFFADLPSIAPHVTRPDSPVAALAITSRERSPLLPEVPTARELGMPGFEVMSWYGIFAPRSTPVAIAERLNREINAALRAPEVQARLSAINAQPAPLSQPEFASFYQSEIERWREVIRRAEMPMID
jgi:tripartite-type tricarboxylate transporter receptor subunit TctC